ncbi:aldo/keto reductase [Streptomyces sp. NPDC006923]|uniref:aldo/keto reductase n=1 Tax=Streptomyces sp. NPDC006923 TaxID=3155355 RepID=UPI003410E9DF
MEYRQLGSTGVYVSAISLGTMTFGGPPDHPIWGLVGALPLEESDKILGTALDAGVNLIDTADGYGDGECEEILGKLLGSRRSDVVLTTKLASRMGPGPNDVGLSRLAVMRGLENSLRRLNTDYIDLYQIHTFDSLTALEETLTALDDAVRQGKVRYIGASNLTAWQTMKALGISERRGLARFAALESYYSLAGRDIEAEILPMARDQELGHLIYSPLAGGLLSGKFDRNGAADASARRSKADRPPVDRDRAYDIIDCLRAIAERHNSGVARVAVAWVLAQPGVTSVILGARRPEQLAETLGALELELTEQDLAELDAVSSPVVPAYPRYMQEEYLRYQRLPQS